MQCNALNCAPAASSHSMQLAHLIQRMRHQEAYASIDQGVDIDDDVGRNGGGHEVTTCILNSSTIL